MNGHRSIKLPRFFRLLTAYILGDDDRRIPIVPQELPSKVKPIVVGNVRLLTEYQDAEYAKLYMDRVGRFINRKGIDDQSLNEIARLLAIRMAYEDMIWRAQQVLAHTTALHAKGLKSDLNFTPLQPTLKEISSMFPASIADPVLRALALAGWTETTVPLSVTARNWWGRMIARLIASLRRLRPRSVRYLQERALVERWLHMIDRALTRQPSATWEIIQTAMLLRGMGEEYKQLLFNWRLIIDNLIKPTFDGKLKLPDLGDRLARLRLIAASDPSGQQVQEAIADIKAELAHAA